MLLAALLTAGIILPARGQYYEGPVAEWEVGVGTTEGRPGRYINSFRDMGPQLYAEGRIYFADSWDAGMQVMGGTAKNRYDGYETSRILAALYVDYLLLPGWHDIRPFVGVGFGSGYVFDDELPKYYDEYGDETGFNQYFFSPRIGVTLLGRVRLSVDWKFMSSNDYSTVGLNLGFTFGGGRWRR